MPKILILGGTGFIGKNLKLFFESRNNHIILSPTRQDLNLLDSAECKLYLKKHTPDIVIHAAVDINSAENSLKMFFNIYNEKNHYGHLIQLGSGAEYDKRYYQPKMNELQFGKSTPIDTYGLAKYLIARELESSKSTNVINLRLFGIFGPYENFMRRFISNNICRAMADQSISINRDMFFDFIDVHDLAIFLEGLIFKLPLNSVSYNFCTGKPIYLSELAAMIMTEMNLDGEINIKEPGLNPEYSGSPKKIFDELGHFEFTPIKQSIKSLINFYKNYLTEDNLKEIRNMNV
jgi:UDP-glucose 4-epimerase